jgi:MFS family permease
MGVVNLFADMTYEGGGSINGQFLGTLGATAAAISIIAGVGEFLGYVLRSVAGYIADRTGRHWLITFIGYTINLLAVPAMALAGSWQVAAGLILAERIGRAIRKPTVEAMLSYSTGSLGKGWVYALNSALDETGAALGPLLVALVLYLNGSYQIAYALLLISSLLALVSLTAARISFPVPARLEHVDTASAKGFTAAYWLYMAAGTCFAAGMMSYELIAFHLSSTGVLTGPWIPVVLAFATGCGVVAGLVFGRLFDRIGLPAVLIAVACRRFSCRWSSRQPRRAAPRDATLGPRLRDAGHAAEGHRRGRPAAQEAKPGFRLFYGGYGSGWLIGSIATGLLYEQSRAALVVFAVCAQLLSLPFFIAARRQERRST